MYFDLPVKTADDRRRYTKFRKYLLSQGFVMMQKSVYSKIALNATAANIIRKNLEENCPTQGNIQILSISENQFQRIDVLVGESQREVIDTLDRFLIL